jgi:hypothetical protein
MQILVREEKDWALHIESLDVASKVHRISLSNMYKIGKVQDSPVCTVHL